MLSATEFNSILDRSETRRLPPASGLVFHNFGLRSFAEMRRIQEGLVQARIAGECSDIILFCEHPPTLSLGRRTRDEDLKLSLDSWRSMGTDVVLADRGGGATFHGPGQLMIYPVVSLASRRMGVRRFVESGLSAIVEGLSWFDIESVSATDPAGVWVLDRSAGRRNTCLGEDLAKEGRKIASVGLRMKRGVTNHGFSVNVACSLRPFSYFIPCGLADAQVTSVAKEIGQREDILGLFTRLVAVSFEQAVCGPDFERRTRKSPT